MAQNSMSKTSTILLCITKGSSKIYQIEIKLWLSEVLQKHQSSIMFIHSVISENDKNVPSIVCDFHMKCGKRDTLGFFKSGDFKVSYLKF